MIDLTRLNGSRFILNAEMILEIEATPDTIITLASGKKIMVREPVEDVRKAVLEYKQGIVRGFPPEEKNGG